MSSTSTRLANRAPVQLAAAAVGVVFLLVGILGLIPGFTTNFAELKFYGHESDARLLGIFVVSGLHSIVHLGFGVAGLVMSRTAAAARTFLLVGGVIYLVLWVYGLVIDMDAAINFVPVNAADNWLHLVLGVVMIALGLLLPRMARPAVR